MGAAAACVHQDRLASRVEIRQPGVDVAPCHLQRALGVIELAVQGAAAAGLRCDDRLDAKRIEYACRGGIDVRQHRRLHAAAEQQHLPCMAARWPGTGILRGWDLLPQCSRQQGAQCLPKLQRGREGATHQRVAQCGTRQCLGWWAAGLFGNHTPADVEQTPVLDSRRAGRLAAKATQAAVEVQLCRCARRSAFEHLLHQVDAPARTVELIATQLVGRAGCVAEAAVHAPADDSCGFLTVGCVPDEIGQIRLHVQKSGYMRPGFRMPAGSNSAFRRR